MLFDPQPGDGWPLVILLGHSFLKGAVRVHDGDKFIASLGELMTEHPEVGSGIIHVLCIRCGSSSDGHSERRVALCGIAELPSAGRDQFEHARTEIGRAHV